MRVYSVVVFLYTVLFFLLNPLELWARAGGGGGGSGGGGIVTIIVLPVVLIYTAILHYKLNKKNKEAKALLRKLSTSERLWDERVIKKRIEEVFFRVQQAWMERNQDLVKDCVSERLYQKHKIQTGQMLQNKRKNILEQINLIEAKVVEVLDFKDDTKDSLWIHISGSMIDYTIDERSHRIISGKKDKIETFEELWKFVRGPTDWLLDEIDQKVSFSDLNGFSSFSEGMRAS